MREGTSPSVWTAIEEATRGQKENPVWHTMQNGVVMAYDFKNVIEGTELLRSSDVSEGYVTDPIMERKVKFQSIAAKKWEVAVEKEALDKYWQKRLSKTRSNLPTELKRTGIIMSRSHPLVGASPHAIVYTKHNPRPLCVVLVKRSYLDRNKHPKEVEQGEVDHAPNKRLCIGQGHRWFYEAQATMGVVGVRLCDVVMATNKGIRIKRVAADCSFYAILEDTVHKFAKEHIHANLVRQADYYHYDGPSSSDYNSTSESESDETSESESGEESVVTKLTRFWQNTNPLNEN